MEISEPLAYKEIEPFLNVAYATRGETGHRGVRWQVVGMERELLVADGLFWVEHFGGRPAGLRRRWWSSGA